MMFIIIWQADRWRRCPEEADGIRKAAPAATANTDAARGDILCNTCTRIPTLAWRCAFGIPARGSPARAAVTTATTYLRIAVELVDTGGRLLNGWFIQKGMQDVKNLPYADGRWTRCGDHQSLWCQRKLMTSPQNNSLNTSEETGLYCWLISHQLK